MDESVWWIPLTFTTKSTANFSKTVPSLWLSDKGPKAIPDLKVEGEWIIFNLQISAPYKVYYDPMTWNSLKMALQEAESYLQIHPLNRRQIMEDVFQLAGVGKVSYDTAFSLVSKCIKNERDFLPLNAVLSSLREIAIKLKRTPNYEYFQNYTKELLKPTLRRGIESSLMFVPRDIKAKEEKKVLIEFASFYEIGSYEDEAVKLFGLWMKEKGPDSVNRIPKEVRKDVSCTAIQKGGKEEWDFLWTRYLNSKFAAERSRILSALCCSRKEPILIRFLNRSIDESCGIRYHESASIFSEIVLQEPGFTTAKSFLIQRVDDIYAFHGSKNNVMGEYIKALAKHMNSKDERNEIEAFTKKHAKLFRYSIFEIQEALNMIDNNVRWYESYYDEIPKLLRTAS